MSNAIQPPRRMLFSFESRCRVVSLVLAGQSPQAAAAACGASRATGYRLWARYEEGGWAALVDRPPVPKRQPRRLSCELEQRILAAREYAKAGPLTVAGQLGLPASTVWKVLRRYGVSRLPRPARLFLYQLVRHVPCGGFSGLWLGSGADRPKHRRAILPNGQRTRPGHRVR